MSDLLDAAFLERTFMEATLLDWIVLVGAWIGIAIVLMFVRRVAAGRFQTLAERTTNRVDDVVAELLKGTRAYFLIFVALMIAGLVRPMPDPVVVVIKRLALLAFVVQAGQWATALITWWIEDYRQRKAGEDQAQVTAVKALGLGLRIVLWSVLLLLALDNLGVNVTSLVAGLGIGGVALALAVQNVLQDILAYVSIVVDQPFVYGDFLIVDTFAGTVEHIGIKTTRLRSLSGEQLIFSNSDLLSSRVRNFKRMYERRALFTIGVLYGTPHEKLASIPDMLREAVEQQEDVRFDRAHFKEFADSSLNFEIVYYVLKPDYVVYMDIQQAINLTLVQRFAEEGIEFAYPTHTLHVESMPALSLAGIGAVTDAARPGA